MCLQKATRDHFQKVMNLVKEMTRLMKLEI